MRLSWAVLLLGLAGCSPSARTIARSDADGLGGSGALGGAAGAAGDVAQLEPPLQRGRVRVVDGELVSDVGSRLRGVLMPLDVGYELPNLELVRAISHEAGLNALHVYAENSGLETGVNLAQVDALVGLAASAGIYIVLGIGGGAKNFSFDLDKVRAFWSLYGPRYANQTHVLYEIQNNPELTCEAPVKPETLALQQEMFEFLRGVAPETHLVLFSGSSLVRPAVLSDLIERLAPFADFSSSSIALHVDLDPPCQALGELEGLHQVALGASVPLLISQVPDGDWAAQVATLEGARVSWLLHGFLNSAPLSELISATSTAGLSWCPDFGTFPQDASQCEGP